MSFVFLFLPIFVCLFVFRSIVYAACLEGCDPVRLFEKRINARRGMSECLYFLNHVMPAHVMFDYIFTSHEIHAMPFFSLSYLESLCVFLS